MFLDKLAYCFDPETLNELMKLIEKIEGDQQYSQDHPLRYLEGMRTNWTRKLRLTHNYQYWSIFWRHVDRYYHTNTIQEDFRRVLEILQRQLAKSLQSLEDLNLPGTLRRACTAPKRERLRRLVNMASNIVNGSENPEPPRDTEIKVPISAPFTIDEEIERLLKAEQQQERQNESGFAQLGNSMVQQLSKQPAESQQDNNQVIRKGLLEQICTKERRILADSIARVTKVGRTLYRLEFDSTYRTQPLDMERFHLLKLINRETFQALLVHQPGPYCHCCLQHLEPANLVECQHNQQAPYVQAFAENPFEFMKAMYKDCPVQEEPYAHPFLSFKQCSRTGRLICGRTFSKACFKELRKNLPKAQRKKKFTARDCPFCAGHCKCYRCNETYQVIRLQAEYLRYGGAFAEIKHDNITNLILERLQRDRPRRRRARK